MKKNGNGKHQNGNGNGSKATSADGAKKKPTLEIKKIVAVDAPPKMPTEPTPQGRKPVMMGTHWHDAFIEKLATIGFVRAASVAIGINHDTAYQHRKRYPEFAMRWDEAVHNAARAHCEALESTAILRATQPYKLQTFRRTKVSKNRYAMVLSEETLIPPSVPMMQFMLKAANPQRFRENFRHEITGPDGKPFTPVVNATQVNIHIVDNHRDVKQLPPIEQYHAASEPTNGSTEAENGNGNGHDDH